MTDFNYFDLEPVSFPSSYPKVFDQLLCCLTLELHLLSLEDLRILALAKPSK